jgi:hypothetical protein
MLRYAGCATLVVADNCIYPPNFVKDLWVQYLNNPCNVYAGETKIIALDSACNPLPYELWGTHGRLYEDREGYRDQMALATGGLLIPPSTLTDTFNKKALSDYIDAADALLHCSIVASGLKVARVTMCVERNGEDADIIDSAECVNRLIKEYRVL